MDIRRTIVSFAAFLMLVTLFGGYQYFSEAKIKAMKDEHQRVDSLVQSYLVHFSTHLKNYRKETRLIAGLPAIKNAFLKMTPQAIQEASRALDYYNAMHETDVSYLMDTMGKVIASSNRESPLSFVGKNYGFRPYFHQALQGNSSLYAAIGVTTGKRGLFSSHPVYGPSLQPIGVVVVKVSADFFEKGFSEYRDGFMVVSAANGMVFIASKKQYENNLLWPVTDETLREIKESRQFGEGPWPWSGMEKQDKNKAVNPNGDTFTIHQVSLTGLPGWELIFFHDENAVVRRVYGPLLKGAGIEVVTLCLVVISLIAYLYMSAEKNLRRRRIAETEREKTIVKLKKALEEIKSLKGIIPICCHCKKIRSDKGYWQQVDVYLQRHSDVDVSHGICPECLQEHYPEYCGDEESAGSEEINDSNNKSIT